jgi:hypothetical protein
MSVYFGEADHPFQSMPTSDFGLMATTDFADADHRSARLRWTSTIGFSDRFGGLPGHPSFLAGTGGCSPGDRNAGRGYDPPCR